MAVRVLLSLLTVTDLCAAEPRLFEPDPFTSGQQLRGQAEGSDPFGDTVEEQGRSEKWLRDISTRTKNHFKKLLKPLQTPIVQEYQILKILDGYANYTMQMVANATGNDVVWNRTGRWLSELSEEEPRELRKQELPPRARYINKILIYLNKEMEVVWNMKTIVDRKRWGVGNVITSSPYGPHGEHPERWRANGSFPFPTLPNSTILLQDKKINLVIRIKPDIEEHENKYAKQLQADYESLVYNINDASQKISDLRTRLWKMEDFAQQFIVLPSGVWNKIVKALLAEAPNEGLPPEEAVQLLELLLESLCDLLQPSLVQAIWFSFDGDWRRPPLLEQIAGKAVQLVSERPPTSERPLPAHLSQLCSAVLTKIIAAFISDTQTADSDEKLAASNAELERLQKQWQIRRSVWELMGKIEESPKKARAIFEKSGLAEAIPVPPVGGLAAGEPGTEEWVLKLVWLLRTVNFAVPYSAVGEFFGQPKEDSEKAVTSFAETFDWGAADIEKAGYTGSRDKDKSGAGEDGLRGVLAPPLLATRPCGASLRLFSCRRRELGSIGTSCSQAKTVQEFAYFWH
ncbi:BIG2 [Symbiodinium microadriaticum]|nr:BIG2 [Symbiodinium microadriaticum]